MFENQIANVTWKFYIPTDNLKIFSQANQFKNEDMNNFLKYVHMARNLCIDFTYYLVYQHHPDLLPHKEKKKQLENGTWEIISRIPLVDINEITQRLKQHIDLEELYQIHINELKFDEYREQLEKEKLVVDGQETTWFEYLEEISGLNSKIFVTKLKKAIDYSVLSFSKTLKFTGKPHLYICKQAENKYVEKFGKHSPSINSIMVTLFQELKSTISNYFFERSKRCNTCMKNDNLVICTHFSSKEYPKYKDTNEKNCITIQVSNNPKNDNSRLKLSYYKIIDKQKWNLSPCKLQVAEFFHGTNSNKMKKKLMYFTAPSIGLEYRIPFIQTRPFPIGTNIKQIWLKREPKSKLSISHKDKLTGKTTLVQNYNWYVGFQIEFPCDQPEKLSKSQEFLTKEDIFANDIETDVLGIDKSINIPYMDSQHRTFGSEKLYKQVQDKIKKGKKLILKQSKKWTTSQYSNKVRYIENSTKFTEEQKQRILVSLQKPSNSSLKLGCKIRKISQDISKLNEEWSKILSRKIIATKDISKQLIIAVEDLSGLTKSKIEQDKLSKKHPKWLQRKLNKMNREVLPAYTLQQKLTNKTIYQNDVTLVKIHAALTSRTCSSCKHVNKTNDKSKKDGLMNVTLFICENQECPSHQNTKSLENDYNASLNIKDIPLNQTDKIVVLCKQGRELWRMPKKTKKKKFSEIMENSSVKTKKRTTKKKFLTTKNA